MIKANKTVSNWLASTSPEKQLSLLKEARQEANALREKHISAEKVVKRTTKECLNQKAALVAKKDGKKVEEKQKIVQAVKKHGGPCCKVDDADRVLDR